MKNIPIKYTNKASRHPIIQGTRKEGSLCFDGRVFDMAKWEYSI